MTDTARVSRLSTVTAYTAVSLAVAALAFTDHTEAALALAAPAFSWLQGATHRRLQRVEASLGPANGQSVHELLQRLIALDTYTHQRNHDILNALTPPNARLEIDLLELLDRVPPLPPPTEGTDHS